MTPYLDSCLKGLGLHTEARTSFITYWLPSLLKHEYVALRFVPQQSYSQAAPITVEPSPDVIVRVFMIFKGIPAEDIGRWSLAQARVQEDVSHWRGVVGLSVPLPCPGVGWHGDSVLSAVTAGVLFVILSSIYCSMSVQQCIMFPL